MATAPKITFNTQGGSSSFKYQIFDLVTTSQTPISQAPVTISKFPSRLSKLKW
jgi:hypothetical protein